MKIYTNFIAILLIVSATAKSQDLMKIHNLYNGHKGGNGGISVAADFSMVASNFQLIWKSLCDKESTNGLSCRNIKDFSTLLDKNSHAYTKIHSKESTHAYDGEEREATNDGFNTINVDKASWLEMQKSNDKEDKLRMIKLVIHEYFSILGLDASDYYKASNTVIGIILRKGILPSVITRPEGIPDLCSTNLTEENIIEDKELSVLKNKGYKINPTSETSRFTLKIKRACFKDSFGPVCTIYTELVDNFMAKTIFSDLYAKKSVFRSDAKLRKKILEESLSKIKLCK